MLQEVISLGFLLESGEKDYSKLPFLEPNRDSSTSKFEQLRRNLHLEHQERHTID